MSDSRIQMLIWAGVAAFLIAAPTILSNVYWTSVLVLIGINVLLTVSLRTMGLIGHFSLGHVGFMLIGAYTSALLVMKADIPFGIALVAAGFLSGTVALALGYPFLRVKGIYFAILTLLTAESFRLLAFNWRSLTMGQVGLMGIPAPGQISIPVLGQIRFDTANGHYYLTLVVVAISLLILYRLERSQLGTIWRAIRETDKLAGSVGINVLWFKILNFGVGCFFAGIAGVLFVVLEGSVFPDLLFWVYSLEIFIMCLLGGWFTFAGPIFGAAIMVSLRTFASIYTEYWTLILGVILILLIFFLPEGVWGYIQEKFSRQTKETIEGGSK